MAFGCKGRVGEEGDQCHKYGRGGRGGVRGEWGASTRLTHPRATAQQPW